MREIEFRGRRVDNGEWVYGYYVYTQDNHRIIYEDKEGYYCEDEVIPETVGQFTGLKDKHGKEIYEGDIVKDEEGRIAYIVFLKQEMGYVMTYKKSDHRLGHRNRKSQYDIDYNLEIIGNIYENPELIVR